MFYDDCIQDKSTDLLQLHLDISVVCYVLYMET